MIDFKVSVIMACYNSEATILEAVNSVIEQTYIHWELIIIDDCSTDSTKVELERFSSHPRITVLYNPTNIGAGLSRNKGIGLSTGTLISFLDSDDVWFPKRLEQHVNFMVSQGATISHTNYHYIEDGVLSQKVFQVSRRNVDFNKLLLRTEMSCLTTMYRVDIVGKDFLMKSIRRKQDYDFWLRMLLIHGESKPMRVSTAAYRINRKQKKVGGVEKICDHFLFLRGEIGLTALKSFWYTLIWANNAFFRYLLK